MSKMGLNQVELSKKTGIRQALISDWLRGRHEPKLPMLLKLSRYFQISLAELTGLESLRDIEKEAEDIKEFTDEEKAFLEAYSSLPEDDWRRKAIDDILTRRSIKEK